MSRPAELHLVRHHEIRWMLVPAGALVAFAAIAPFVVWLFDDRNDFRSSWVAAAQVGLLALAALGVWLAFHVALLATERRHAEAVLAAPLACWSQYSTPAQWSKQIDDVVEAERADPMQVVGPVGVLTAAIVLITVVSAMTNDAGPVLAIGVAVVVIVWLVALVVIGLRAWRSHRSRARTRDRLEALEPFPRCWVAEDGAYFEDTGLVRFTHVAAVELVEPGDLPDHRRDLTDAGMVNGMEFELVPLDTRLSKAGWAFLTVSSSGRAMHTIWQKLVLLGRPSGYRNWRRILHVRVPPDQVFQAHEIAARIGRRWLR